MLQIWDLASGERLLSLAPPEISIWGMRFSPDGARLVTSGADGIVRIWDVATGELRQSFQAHAGFNRAVAFSPDGSRLYTGGVDGLVRVFLLDPAELVALARTRVTRSLSEAECRQYLHLSECPTE